MAGLGFKAESMCSPKPALLSPSTWTGVLLVILTLPPKGAVPYGFKVLQTSQACQYRLSGTQAQRGQKACLKPHSHYVVGQGQDTRAVQIKGPQFRCMPVDWGSAATFLDMKGPVPEMNSSITYLPLCGT